MSRVIGFRLDKDNPREAQALAILETWQEQGYSTRHILTEALLSLVEKKEKDTSSLMVEVITILNDLLEQVQNGQQVQPISPAATPAQLSNSFLRSVREAAKSGLGWEE